MCVYHLSRNKPLTYPIDKVFCLASQAISLWRSATPQTPFQHKHHCPSDYYNAHPLHADLTYTFALLCTLTAAVKFPRAVTPSAVVAISPLRVHSPKAPPACFRDHVGPGTGQTPIYPASAHFDHQADQLLRSHIWRSWWAE